MSSDFTVRRYEPSDAEAVRELHDQWSWDVEHPESEHPNMYADLDDIESEYLESGGEFLVGFEGDRLVATGAFKSVDGTAFLKRIRVDPAYQREGYGTRILDELERRADEAGYDETIIDEMGLNEPAQAFLESHGYEVTERAMHLGNELVSYRKALA
ncbi:MAG: GNAT family N-acetyltransferase [Halapricum sp.]